MRSSGSTLNPPGDRAIPLYVAIAGEDHPRACTGRRLLARRVVERAPPPGDRSPPPVLLDPFARTPLTVSDRDAAVRGGLLVVDCSWNRLSERGRLPGVDRRSIHRRLPILIATNPQHYGRPTQLNTVEAIAAALALLGRPDAAERALAGFRGSEQFLKVNSERLAAYRDARSPAELQAAERRLFGGAPPP